MEHAGKGPPRWQEPPLTDGARRLLAEAHAEADRLRHEYVGTEHVALAAARQADGVAVLARTGTDPERVRAFVEQVVRAGKGAPPPGRMRPYTSRTQQSMTFAAEIARETGRQHVGVEHLLAGMLRERLNIGAQALQQSGLTLDQALAQVHALGAR